MNCLRKLCSTALLTFVLAAAALADDGVIHGDRAPTPTPTPIIDPSGGQSQAYDDGGATDGTADPSNTTDGIVAVMLRVVSELFAIY